jgi:hypothetical protein
MADIDGICDGTGLVIGTGLGPDAGGAWTIGLGVGLGYGCCATADRGSVVRTVSISTLVTILL